MTIPTIFTGAIISQGIYVGLVLWIGKNNRYANRYLGLLLLLSSLWLIDSLLRLTASYETNPDLYFLPIYYSFGFGPLFYFYTRAITQKHDAFKRADLYHFVPVGLQAVFYLYLSLSSYAYKRWFWLDIHRPITYDLEFNLTLISLAIYSYLSIKMIRTYHKWIKNQYSEISKIHLNWFKWAYFLLVSICVFWLTEAILREVFLIYSQLPISAISLGLAILFLGTAGILQADVLSYGIELTDGKKNASSSAEPIDDQLLAFIKSEMSIHNYFLDPELSLKSFSEKLGLPSRQVSWLINQGLHTSYIDFVNTYRVNLVKERLNDEAYAHLTLYGIALESGFNAKSTFNRVFKNITGQTPSSVKGKDG